MTIEAYPELFSPSNSERSPSHFLNLARLGLEAQAVTDRRDSGKLLRLARSLELIAVLLEERKESAA